MVRILLFGSILLLAACGSPQDIANSLMEETVRSAKKEAEIARRSAVEQMAKTPGLKAKAQEILADRKVSSEEYKQILAESKKLAR